MTTPLAPRPTRRPRVVILGGGYGGLYAALELRKAVRRDKLDVTLVSRDNFFLVQPLLPEAVSGNIEPPHIVKVAAPPAPRHRLSSSRDRLRGPRRARGPHPPPWGDRGAPHRLRPPARRRGGLDGPRLAAGHDGARLPGEDHRQRLHAAESSSRHPRAGRGDGIGIRAPQAADVSWWPGPGTPGSRWPRRSTITCGRQSSATPRSTSASCGSCCSSGAGRILPELSERLAAFSQRILERSGIEVWTNTPLASATAESVVLASGERIPTRTLVSALGAGPNPLLQCFDKGLDARGRLQADEFLPRAPPTRNTWVAGDAGAIPNLRDGGRYPRTAQSALRQAQQPPPATSSPPLRSAP